MMKMEEFADQMKVRQPQFSIQIGDVSVSTSASAPSYPEETASTEENNVADEPQSRAGRRKVFTIIIIVRLKDHPMETVNTQLVEVESTVLLTSRDIRTVELSMELLMMVCSFLLSNGISESTTW